MHVSQTWLPSAHVSSVACSLLLRLSVEFLTSVVTFFKFSVHLILLFVFLIFSSLLKLPQKLVF